MSMHPAFRLALVACSVAALASTSALSAADITWNQQTLVAGASATGGILSLKPADQDWGAATAVGTEALACWTATGTHFSLHIEPDVQKDGGNLDGIVTVGLITTPVVLRMQSSDNIIGATIAFKKSQGDAFLGLVRKEKAGPESMHGSKWGDPERFATEEKLTVPAGPIDITVTVTDTTLTVEVPGAGKMSAAHGLTQATWAKAYPAVQVVHFNAGRMNASISKAATK